MQSSISQNFILFSAILAKGKLGTRRGTWSESNTGHGPCWPGFGAAYGCAQSNFSKVSFLTHIKNPYLVNYYME